MKFKARESSDTGCKKYLKNRAFTLVEVMIAMTIMATALTSASMCLRMGLVQYDTARSTSVTTQILQNEAERLRLMSWSEIDDLPFYATIPSDEVQEDKFQFRRYVLDYSADRDLKQIWLIGYWTGLGGEWHQRRIIFNYAKNGTYDYYYGTSG